MLKMLFGTLFVSTITFIIFSVILISVLKIQVHEDVRCYGNCNNIIIPTIVEEYQELNYIKELIVHATSYNAEVGQTDSTPNICAWGDRIRPGIIAVSRDLEPLGLTRGTVVFIEGYEEPFVVLDRMNKRWTKRIDIYMPEKKDSLEFGFQEVKIFWSDQKES